MSEQSPIELCAQRPGTDSDKWSSYLHEYDRLLEIYIQNCASLEVRSNYFSVVAALKQ